MLIKSKGSISVLLFIFMFKLIIYCDWLFSCRLLFLNKLLKWSLWFFSFCFACILKFQDTYNYLNSTLHSSSFIYFYFLVSLSITIFVIRSLFLLWKEDLGGVLQLENVVFLFNRIRSIKVLKLTLLYWNVYEVTVSHWMDCRMYGGKSMEMLILSDQVRVHKSHHTVVTIQFSYNFKNSLIIHEHLAQSVVQFWSHAWGFIPIKYSHLYSMNLYKLIKTTTFFFNFQFLTISKKQKVEFVF